MLTGLMSAAVLHVTSARREAYCHELVRRTSLPFICKQCAASSGVCMRQAMIEGLGILLTRMTAPPPAPPPLMEPAPQPGVLPACLCAGSFLRRAAPGLLTVFAY